MTVGRYVLPADQLDKPKYSALARVAYEALRRCTGRVFAGRGGSLATATMSCPRRALVGVAARGLPLISSPGRCFSSSCQLLYGLLA